MKTLLAVDSAGGRFSCAVIADIHRPDDAPFYTEAQSEQHSQVALPLLNQALQKSGLALGDIDVFSFNAGPGRFSALRLVCALARTLAYALDKKLVAVPGFCALAHANFGRQDITVKCALPAHRGHIYWGSVRHRDGCWQTHKAAQTRASDANPLLPALAYACGSGFAEHPQLLGSARLTTRAAHTDARHIAATAADFARCKIFASPPDATPVYARRKIALTIAEREKIRQQKIEAAR